MNSSVKGTKYPGVKPTDKKPWLPPGGNPAFGPGNQLAKQRKSALRRALNEIPEEYHVTCTADDDLVALNKYIEDMATFARNMHERIGRTDHVDDNRHVAAYGAIRNALQAYRQQLQSGRLGGYPFKLNPEQVAAAKAEYASILQINLTRLKYTVAQMEERESEGKKGMYNSKGTLFAWAGRDTAEMMGRTLTTIKSWVELLIWEASHHDDAEVRVVESYAREVNAQAEQG